MTTFIEILERIKLKIDKSKDKEIAEILYTTEANLNKWKSRNKIPYEQLFKLCEDKNININEIIYGKNDKNIQNDNKNNSGIQINGNNGHISNIHINSMDEMDKELCNAVKSLRPKRKEYYFYKIKAELLEEEK